jgi:hypothetical protein
MQQFTKGIWHRKLTHLQKNKSLGEGIPFAKLVQLAKAEQVTEDLESSLLDKLEQKGTPLESSWVKRAKKRAKQKHLSSLIADGLIDYTEELNWRKGMSFEDDLLFKGFLGMTKCMSSLTITKDKVTSRYCGHRLCLVCSNIRTGKMLNRFEATYKEKFTDPHFVTLTAPNVPPDKLGQEVKKYLAVYDEIRRTIRAYLQRRKEPYRLCALRKLEITWNKQRNDYHPHLHLIVNDEFLANEFRRLWLDKMPEANLKAQHIEKANEKSLKEVFKYVTKFFTEDKKTKKLKIYPPQVLYQITQALYRVRTFGTINLPKEITEIEADPIQEDNALEGLIQPDKPILYTYVGSPHWNWYEADPDSLNADPLVPEYDSKSKRLIRDFYNSG